MCDYSRERFYLELLKKMIVKKILKESTNQINDWLTNQTNQLIKPIIEQLNYQPIEQTIY